MLAGAIADGEAIDSICGRAVELYGEIQELQAEFSDPENPLDVIPLPGEVRAAVEHWLGLCKPLLEPGTNSPEGRTFRLSFEELSELIAADHELQSEVPALKWLSTKGAREVAAR